MPPPAERATRLIRPVAVVAATAAWVISALVNDLQGWSLIGSLVGGAALTALAVGLPLFVERQASGRARSAEQIAQDARARMQLVLDDALEPLVFKIGEITDLPRFRGRGDLDRMQAEAKTVVLVAAAEVLGADRLRSCFYRLDDDQLVPDGHHGRSGAPPRAALEPDTPAGAAAIAQLTDRADVFCRDIAEDDPPWRPEGTDFRTFLAVPVATEGRAFGIMTVDGLEVGDLSADDVAAARIFARLLAVALNS